MRTSPFNRLYSLGRFSHAIKVETRSMASKEHSLNNSFHLRGKEGARLASSNLSTRRDEYSELGLEKLNSPEA
jgi:hypothetical protein